MKLGVSYNLFDGEELLYYSIQSIRKQVDYINIIYQTISYYGNKASDDLEKLLQILLKKKFVDELYHYETNLEIKPSINQTCKRNIGLQLAKKAGCTHFMNMDTDEFYDAEQFKKAKRYIVDNNIGCSAVPIVSYIQKPIYRIEGLRDAYVPFICEIDDSSEIKRKAFFPVLIDPTRGFSGHKTFHLFDSGDIVMHHMGLVRQDIEKKFSNTSSASSERIQMLRMHTLNWKLGESFQYTDDSPPLDVIRVDNQFNISFKKDKLTLRDYLPQKVLLTNHHLVNFAGSEITTLELAIVLKELGYEVNVATFEYNDPIKAVFEQKNINVVNVLENELTELEYDFAWCHHAPVLTHLLSQKVIIKNVIFRSLSSHHPLEAPPSYVNDIDITLANSKETAKRYVADGWIKKSDIDVFPNSVMDKFFLQSKANHNDTISKIAVVSNHVPKEVEEAADILRKQSINVDVIGLSSSFQLVTPDTLLPYDVVITIGKTVPYCLALKIPVFCYDRFGGPGYITKDNLERAEFYNFSGRCCGKQIQAIALSKDILSGFPDALKNLEELKTIAEQRYHLKSNVKKIVNRLKTMEFNNVFYKQKFTPDILKQIVQVEWYTNRLKRMFRSERRFVEKTQLLERTRAEIKRMKHYCNDRYREELYSVYTSRSWRYTAALRKIGNLIRRVLMLLHKPRIRSVIKRAYFLLPSFIRNGRTMEKLKNRFKSKEIAN